MKIKLLVVGKVKESYLRDGIAEYCKRMQTMVPVEVVEVADERIPERAGDKEKAQVIEHEGARLLAKISQGDQVVSLAIAGKLLSSEELSEYVHRAVGTAASAGGSLVFVIGGSLGLSQTVLSRSNLLLSFGRLTLPHQLMRLVLAEQVYRAQMIQHGTAYHK